MNKVHRIKLVNIVNNIFNNKVVINIHLLAMLKHNIRCYKK